MLSVCHIVIVIQEAVPDVSLWRLFKSACMLKVCFSPPPFFHKWRGRGRGRREGRGGEEAREGKGRGGREGEGREGEGRVSFLKQILAF
jgi:hypothetical protein